MIRAALQSTQAFRHATVSRRIYGMLAGLSREFFVSDTPTTLLEGDIEAMMDRIEKETSRPPPKVPSVPFAATPTDKQTNKQKKRLGKVQHQLTEAKEVEERKRVEAERIFRAYPPLSDLIDGCGLVDGLGKLDAASNFVNQYILKWEVEQPKAYRWNQYCLHTRNIKKVKVALVMAVHPESLVSSYGHVKRVIGIGEGKSATDAKKVARIDLARRLRRILEDPESLMTGTKKGVAINEGYVKVDLTSETKQQLLQTFERLNEERVFEAEVGTQIENRPRRRYYDCHQPFRSLGSETIRALPIPDRIEGHPLPVCKHYHRVLEAIDMNQVCVISAATGSGKTTQLPQFILEQFANGTDQSMGKPPRIVVTQPRRIAAKSVAKRIAQERNEHLGRSVGYSVRFETISPTTPAHINFCTSGVLLRMLQTDPMLSSYTHIILDEVHERDVYTDILLLAMKNLLSVRPNLRLVLMSATMQVDRIKRYFTTAGLSVGEALDIDGTNYPVMEHYLEDVVRMIGNGRQFSESSSDYLKAELNGNPEEGLQIESAELKETPSDAIASLIVQLAKSKPPGAILCFLPGWEDLVEVNKCLQNSGLNVFLVHSTSPSSTTDAIFDRNTDPSRRKVILATNIAESSVTIPDVVYVIDSGKQKIMNYDQGHRMDMLETCWISRANLRQRLGRAGRCQPGEYWSFMSRERAESAIADQTPPELLRLGLEEVCLSVKAMGFKDPCTSVLRRALDAPETMAVRQSVDRLTRLGAFDEVECLTPLGKLLADLPLHPAFGRMLVLGVIFKCLDPILTIVSSLGEKVFRPARMPEEKLALGQILGHLSKDHHQTKHSDHILTHRLYQCWKLDPYLGQLARDSGLHSAINNQISFPTLKRLDEIRSKLSQTINSRMVAEGSGEDLNTNADNQALIRFIIASGFYPDVALYKGKRNSYQLGKLRHVNLATSSINYELALQNIRKAGITKPLALLARKQPPRPIYYVYEDLLDIGIKLLMRTTAVDPMVFALLAFDLQVKENSLLVDRWLTIKSDSAMDLRVLNETRLHLGNFLQWSISKRLAKQDLDPEERQLQDTFIDALLGLLSNSDINRPRLLKA